MPAGKPEPAPAASRVRRPLPQRTNEPLIPGARASLRPRPSLCSCAGRAQPSRIAGLGPGPVRVHWRCMERERPSARATAPPLFGRVQTRKSPHASPSDMRAFEGRSACGRWIGRHLRRCRPPKAPVAAAVQGFQSVNVDSAFRADARGLSLPALERWRRIALRVRRHPARRTVRVADCRDRARR